MIKEPAREPEELVSPRDLQQLPALHQILAVLNDEHAGAPEIARCVERLPVLKARIARRYRMQHPVRVLPGVAEQVARIGNGEFERMLLELLEDLTLLRGELDAAAERDGVPSSIGRRKFSR
jgi:hypothetical protein